MRIVYFATAAYAVRPLEELIRQGMSPVAVITQPDRPRDRSLAPQSPPIKPLATAHNIRTLQPVCPDEIIDELSALAPDLFVVIAYGCILSARVLAIPRLYAINLHPSLLPRYRGAAPIHWALARQETTTGVTVIKLSQGIDDGPIIAQEPAPIEPEDTACTLHDRLSCQGARLLVETVGRIEKGTVTFTPQNDGGATYAPKLKKTHGAIDWSHDAAQIRDLVRAMQPWPGAYTFLGSDMLKIWACTADPNAARFAHPGSFRVTAKTLEVATGAGVVRLDEVQLENKKRLPIAAFLRGFRSPDRSFSRAPA